MIHLDYFESVSLLQSMEDAAKLAVACCQTLAKKLYPAGEVVRIPHENSRYGVVEKIELDDCGMIEVAYDEHVSHRTTFRGIELVAWKDVPKSAQKRLAGVRATILQRLVKEAMEE